MKEALVNQPIHSMKRPEDITAIKIDPVTGFLADPEQDNAIFEKSLLLVQAPTTTAPEQPPVID